jgi:hypothetical protein
MLTVEEITLPRLWEWISKYFELLTGLFPDWDSSIEEGMRITRTEDFAASAAYLKQWMFISYLLTIMPYINCTRGLGL